MAKLNREQAFALASDREWSDIPKEYAQGANTFLSSALGSLDNSIVGDILRAVKGKPFREQVEMVLSHPDVSQEEKDRIASEYLNADTILQQGQKTLKDYSRFWASQKSKKTQALDRYVSEAEGNNELERFGKTIGRYAENPATIGLQIVGQLPQLLPVMGLSLGLRTKAAQGLLGNSAANTNAATALGALAYQSKVGGQQAREQSLDDYEENRPLNSEEEKAFNDESYKIDPSKINKNLGESDRYNAAKIATDSASKISAAAGLIGLKGDLALTNLLMGRQMGLSKALAMAGNITTNREGEERRNAEQQTWNRRESVNRNGIAQMNGSFGDMNQSSNGMVNTMNQQSAQQAQQAGALFGAAGSIAGQYLGGLKAPTVEPVTTPAPMATTPQQLRITPQMLPQSVYPNPYNAIV